MNAGALVGAVLAPHDAEHAKFGVGGRSAEGGEHTLVLVVGQLVLFDELRRDREVASERGRVGHAGVVARDPPEVYGGNQRTCHELPADLSPCA